MAINNCLSCNHDFNSLDGKDLVCPKCRQELAVGSIDVVELCDHCLKGAMAVKHMSPLGVLYEVLQLGQIDDPSGHDRIRKNARKYLKLISQYHGF